MHPNMTQTSIIDAQTYIAKSAEICGGKVILESQVSLWPQAILRADVKPIVIGKNSNVQDQVMIHGTHDSSYNPGGYQTTVGQNVTIGHKALLHGPTIGNNCIIGMGSIILDGVKVDPFTIIGAGALIPPRKHITSGLWVGSPAKKVRELTEEEISFTQYSADHYWKLAQAYKKG